MNCNKKAMLLYAVTDRAWTGRQTLYQQVEEALKGGITCLQLREKNLPVDEFIAEAFEIKKLCRRYKVPLIINDNVEVAIACDADGVHVGQQDMNVSQVRERIGSRKRMGVSVQTVEQAVFAEKNGADYLGVGAVFPTSTKTDAQTISHDYLRAICDSVSVPVCAIGGISADNILKLAGTGVDGVALVSAIFGNPDIRAACGKLRALSSQMMGV